MIVTDLKNIENQISMTPDFKKAIDFLRRQDLHSLVESRVDIDGKKVFALIQRHETEVREVPKFEAHRKHVDIQYIVSGEEIIGWAPAEEMTITEEYDTHKDICFGTVPKTGMTPLLVKAGQLAVLYPEDGHAPKLAAHESSHVVKIVVKIARQESGGWD
jgi:biofilm protein TabA